MNFIIDLEKATFYDLQHELEENYSQKEFLTFYLKKSPFQRIALEKKVTHF